MIINVLLDKIYSLQEFLKLRENKHINVMNYFKVNKYDESCYLYQKQYNPQVYSSVLAKLDTTKILGT